jgi:excinuclease ABC subunit A
LIETLQRLRDLGNTVIVVEHDEDTIRSCDWLVDIGPGAGEHGGQVVYSGPVNGVLKVKESITGQYLVGARRVEIPAIRRQPNKEFLTIRGAREHNLKNLNVKIPLGCFVAVTGVSGSGKSTLIRDILLPSLMQKIYKSKDAPGRHTGVDGIQYLDKVIDMDQSPIGRTPRSNPATYTGVFDDIRKLFASTPEAKVRGYMPGRFSFNVPGGRCEACSGDGTIKIEMHFLPDVFVPCEVCKGARYNRDTLDITFKGKNVADILDMPVSDAVDFFANQPRISRHMQTFVDVGLGYVRLGQSAPTLSGGEAQRVKLASELSKRSTGHTIYLLDEPTTGLHFEDVRRLLIVLARLVDQGNTVLVIEHNLDVIKTADWVIDLGPEGGNSGGTVVAEGAPEVVATIEASHTGRYLAKMLQPTPPTKTLITKTIKTTKPAKIATARKTTGKTTSKKK